MWKHIDDKVSLFRHRGEFATLHDLAKLYVYVLIVWGFYRAIFRFPIWVEELILKPLVFVIPVMLRIRTDGKTWSERLKSIGVSWKNLFAALAFGLSLGVFYLFVGRLSHVARVGTETGPFGEELEGPLVTMVLAAATAISEEILFAGYFLLRLQKIWKHELRSVTTIAAMFAAIHIPILVFSHNYPPNLLVGQFLLTFVLGFGNGVLMLRLNNVVAPILSHALWGMTVLLFR